MNLNVGVPAGSIFALLCFGVALWSNVQMRASFDRSVEQHAYASKLQHLFSLVQDAETGSRGFTLTGDESYLEPFTQAIQHVGPTLDALRMAPSGVAHAEELRSFETLWHNKLEASTQNIVARREKGLEAVAKLTSLGAGKRTMDEIRALYSRLHAMHQSSLEKELKTSEFQANLALVSMALGSAAGFITGAYLVYLLLRVSNERLALLEESESREASLAQSNLALSRANEELQHFAYVASHDLQEPLRSIAGYVQLLERRYETQLDEKALGYIRKSVAAAERMQQLIEGLLAYTRVNTQAKPHTMVPIEAVLRDIEANLAASLAESGAVLAHDPLPTVWADRLQVTQLMQNLISNALKFRTEEQQVKIHVGAVRVGDRWQISVRDNGIGIEPEYSGRIFKVFQRLHTRQEYPGTGVGLAICKRIIERHGGAIWFESEPGKGTAFHFTLPAGAVDTLEG